MINLFSFLTDWLTESVRMFDTSSIKFYNKTYSDMVRFEEKLPIQVWLLYKIVVSYGKLKKIK